MASVHPSRQAFVERANGSARPRAVDFDGAISRSRARSPSYERQRPVSPRGEPSGRRGDGDSGRLTPERPLGEASSTFAWPPIASTSQIAHPFGPSYRPDGTAGEQRRIQRHGRTATIWQRSPSPPRARSSSLDARKRSSRHRSSRRRRHGEDSSDSDSSSDDSEYERRRRRRKRERRERARSGEARRTRSPHGAEEEWIEKGAALSHPTLPDRQPAAIDVAAVDDDDEEVGPMPAPEQVKGKADYRECVSCASTSSLRARGPGLCPLARTRAS